MKITINDLSQEKIEIFKKFMENLSKMELNKEELSSRLSQIGIGLYYNIPQEKLDLNYTAKKLRLLIAFEKENIDSNIYKDFDDKKIEELRLLSKRGFDPTQFFGEEYTGSQIEEINNCYEKLWNEASNEEKDNITINNVLSELGLIKEELIDAKEETIDTTDIPELTEEQISTAIPNPYVDMVEKDPENQEQEIKEEIQTEEETINDDIFLQEDVLEFDLDNLGALTSLFDDYFSKNNLEENDSYDENSL